MNFQLGLFLTASLAAHAGLLLWPLHESPAELPIGGQAQSIRVSLARPAAAPAGNTGGAAPETPPQHPAAVAQTALRAPAHEPASTQRPAPTSETAPQKDPPAPAANAATQNTTVTQSRSLHVSERVSAALQSQIAKRFEYPWRARKRGWQGLVTLSLRVEDDGHLTGWKVARTSGHTLLDNAALKAARAIDRLHNAGALLQGEALELEIPVRYQLLDG